MREIPAPSLNGKAQHEPEEDQEDLKNLKKESEGEHQSGCFTMEQEPHNQSEEEKKPKGPMAAEGEHHSSSSSGTTMVVGAAEESASRRTTGPSQTRRSLLLRIKLLKQLGINDVQELGCL